MRAFTFPMAIVPGTFFSIGFLSGWLGHVMVTAEHQELSEIHI